MENPNEELAEGLYVVGTPIGNLGDISPRARQILNTVDTVLCEDTRVSRKLFASEETCPPLRPLHDHNEAALATQILSELKAGKRLALISDAGMPTVSDPGFRVVRACRREGVTVHAVPGPSALTTALAVSGLPSDQFAFFGFLPPKSAARRKNLEVHRESEATLIYFESTHRIEKFVGDIIQVLGPERTICVARELTKRFESVLSGPAGEVQTRLSKGSTKGEFVVLIAKASYEL
jgi:16S rRNA (cytidine1402-2'-O)-methyltransferase|tara:strand:+ start:20937 stop:21644 length:708 start_codon:yes stop_codon:yes gene_type:complete